MRSSKSSEPAFLAVEADYMPQNPEYCELKRQLPRKDIIFDRTAPSGGEVSKHGLMEDERAREHHDDESDRSVARC